jgi:hypothetical protein
VQLSIGNEVNVTPEQVFQRQFEPRQIEQGSVRFRLDQEIEVARLAL